MLLLLKRDEEKSSDVDMNFELISQNEVKIIDVKFCNDFKTLLVFMIDWFYLRV